MKHRRIAGLMAGLFFAGSPALAATPAPVASAAPAATSDVVRATLANGMRVVLLPNALAPVVTTEISYGVGSNDDPMPGIAHATEHMLFRGTKDVSGTQLADIAARAGAEYNAQTTNINTGYYFTVPSSYAGLVLRLEADRMTGATISAAAWKTERGAIEQEIRAHESQPGWTAVLKIRRAMFGDSPYSEDAGGTIPSFEKMTAGDIAAFYKRWYHPNNATLVVAGAIDPAATLAQIHALFDRIPAAPLPARAGIAVAPLGAATIDAGIAELPFPIAGLAYRFPKLSDPDYAASEVLSAALNNGRGALADLSAKGAVLAALAVSSAYREVGIGEIVAVGMPGTPTSAVKTTLEGAIAPYLKDGVPPELVAAAKLRLLSLRSYRKASISGLADTWIGALAMGNASPDEDYAAIARVTPEDVTRVLRTYMQPQHQLTILLEPKKSASLAKVDPKAGVENVRLPGDANAALPAWAIAYFRAPLVPPDDTGFRVSRLPNGLRYTVRRSTVSPVVVVAGSIRTSPDLYAPAGKDGVASMTASLLDYGTTTYDRKAFTAQLDAVAASVSLGSRFGLTVQAANFDEGMRLLADGMLHPAFPQTSFDVIKAQEVKAVAASESLPGTRATIARTEALYPRGDPRRRRETAATAAAVGLADVKHWYDLAYRPDLAVVAIVGDVTPAQARAALTKYFGGWSRPGKPPSFRYPQIAPSAAKSVTVTSAATEEASVTLTQRLAVHTDKPMDRIALQLANTILSGQGTGSLLFRDVRTAKGYVYSIDSDLSVGKTDSTFSIQFAADPKNVRGAEAAATAVIRRMQSAPLPVEEVQRAKALLLAQQVLPLASYDGLASDTLADLRTGYSSADSAFYWRALLETTPAQIRDAMRKWIDPKRFVRVEIAPGS